jgi:hypothetical protein
LGSKAEHVQKKLDDFFALGERWGAIILLDEADVYLEQRSHENLERNGLVSGKNFADAILRIVKELNNYLSISSRFGILPRCSFSHQ